MKGWGVAPLVVPSTPVTVQMGQPVTLTWTPPGKPGPTRIFIDFSINRHGTIDAWLECTVPDTGSFTVTAEMTTALFRNGVSGFPSFNLTRQSGDTTTVMSGCVQLLVAAPVSRESERPRRRLLQRREALPGRQDVPPGSDLRAVAGGH